MDVEKRWLHKQFPISSKTTLIVSFVCIFIYVALIIRDISHFACSEITEGKTESIKSKIQRNFQTAIANRPSILFFDDIDLLAQSSDDGQEVRGEALHK